MRYRVSFFGEASEAETATSESSRAQPSSLHQSPDVRHGPANRMTSPRMLRPDVGDLIRAGQPCGASTSAFSGGRNRRKARRDCGLRIADCGLGWLLLLFTAL